MGIVKSDVLGIMCSSLGLLPEHDVWPPKCRKALPIVAPFPRKMNPLASVPDMQLVLTQLQILAGISHFDASILAIFTTISEKNHMQNVQGCWIMNWMSMSPNNINSFFPQVWVHIPASQGLEMVFQDWNIVPLWFLRTLEITDRLYSAV